MFPVSNTSRTIIDCLLKEANKYGVEILLNVEVNEIKIPNIKSEIRNDYNFRVCFTNSDLLIRILFASLAEVIQKNLCLTGSGNLIIRLKNRYLLYLPSICRAMLLLS